MHGMCGPQCGKDWNSLLDLVGRNQKREERPCQTAQGLGLMGEGQRNCVGQEFTHMGLTALFFSSELFAAGSCVAPACAQHRQPVGAAGEVAGREWEALCHGPSRLALWSGVPAAWGQPLQLHRACSSACGDSSQGQGVKQGQYVWSG